MDPFLAEIRIFAGNFAPTGWATCDGQILPITQNTALFSLLGTTYGGNGTSTFALPNLQGRVPVHPGQGPGLSAYSLGQSGGVESVTLLASEMPQHAHGLVANSALGEASGPANNVHGLASAGNAIYATSAPNTPMNPAALDPTGGGQPHNNMQPYQVLTYIIALQGVYPPRNAPPAGPAGSRPGGSSRE